MPIACRTKKTAFRAELFYFGVLPTKTAAASVCNDCAPGFCRREKGKGPKKTWDLIPMCHPLMLTGIDIEFEYDEKHNAIHIYATVSNEGKTGVEIEALTACSIAALTIYDMCKAVDKDMVISEIYLIEKSGGKSGHYRRGEDNE